MTTEARTEPDPGGHSHTPDGNVHMGCDACRQRAIDSNALAEIASNAILVASPGDVFVHLGLRYGVAYAVLDSPWLAEKITAAEAKGAADERAKVLRLLGDEATVEGVARSSWSAGYPVPNERKRSTAQILAALRALIAGGTGRSLDVAGEGK